MSDIFPESYAGCDPLPFNRTSLEDDFVLKTPADEPNDPGVWLLLQGTRVLVVSQGKELPDTALAGHLVTEKQAVYIGNWQGLPCRLVSVSHSAEIPDSLCAVDILDSESGLPLALLSLAGLGNAILHWEKTSRCCDNCGGDMARINGEWGKKCDACGMLHYPCIHPCIIVLVRRDNEILMVRKPEWVAGFFALVAGFVEFGENLEQTVARELLEETGIEVTNIRYRGSQSWPFPSQLMAGFTADYADGELKLQDDELAEGDWFSLENLPQLPPPCSIARWLIDSALNDL